MQRKKFYKSAILGLIAVLGLEIVYMKNEERKIKDAIISIEREAITESKKKEIKFGRDAGFFLRGIAEVKKLTEKERQLNIDEEIINNIIALLTAINHNDQIYREYMNIFYKYENDIYLACEDLVRYANENDKLPEKDNKSFWDKLKVIVGIAENSFQFLITLLRRLY